jgi:hypothetical protein
VIVVAAQLGHPVLHVAPTPGQLPREVHGGAGDGGAAAGELEERPLGERGHGAHFAHVAECVLHAAGDVAGDHDGGVDLGDRAGLFDGGALADPRGLG